MKRKIFSISLFFLAFIIGCDQGSPLETDATFDTGESKRTPDVSLQQILSSGSAVEVPAGSVDALADAIDAAGPGGTVLLKAGPHYESSNVEINHTVTVAGEAGAKLISRTVTLGATGTTDAALFLHNAANIAIYGLEIVPKGDVGGTAIFSENAPNALIAHNSIKDYEYGIVIHQGNRTKVNKNTIVGSSAWLTGELPDVEGIIIINGDFVEVDGNTVSNTVLGIFGSDRKGLMTNNTMYGNVIGVVLCNVPQVVPTPGGEIVGSETNATRWIVRGNRSHDNFDIGYLVVDGANENYLVNNQGGNNGRYDIELAGDSERFGFFTPTSRKSIVDTGRYGDLVVKDCGVDDQITGGQLVDTVADPCD